MYVFPLCWLPSTSWIICAFTGYTNNSAYFDVLDWRVRNLGTLQGNREKPIQQCLAIFLSPMCTFRSIADKKTDFLMDTNHEQPTCESGGWPQSRIQDCHSVTDACVGCELAVMESLFNVQTVAYFLFRWKQLNLFTNSNFCDGAFIFLFSVEA